MKKIYIGNLSFSVSESTLESFIRELGIDVQKVTLIRDQETGQSRGFGFAELGDQEDVANVVSRLNGKDLEGRTLKVDEARERAPRPGGRGGDRGGRPGGGRKRAFTH